VEEFLVEVLNKRPVLSYKELMMLETRLGIRRNKGKRDEYTVTKNGYSRILHPKEFSQALKEIRFSRLKLEDESRLNKKTPFTVREFFEWDLHIAHLLIELAELMGWNIEPMNYRTKAQELLEGMDEPYRYEVVQMYNEAILEAQRLGLGHTQVIDREGVETYGLRSLEELKNAEGDDVLTVRSWEMSYRDTLEQGIVRNQPSLREHPNDLLPFLSEKILINLIHHADPTDYETLRDLSQILRGFTKTKVTLEDPETRSRLVIYDGKATDEDYVESAFRSLTFQRQLNIIINLERLIRDTTDIRA